MYVCVCVGGGGGGMTDLVGMQEPELMDLFVRWTIALSASLKVHLREDGNIEQELEVGPPPPGCRFSLHQPFQCAHGFIIFCS